MSCCTDQFELVRVEDGHGWQKTAGTLVFNSPHVHVEDVQCLTPTRQDTPAKWTIVHRKAAVATQGACRKAEEVELEKLL